MSDATFPASDLAERLAEILRGLGKAAAHRGARDRLFVPLLLLLWPYLNRVVLRFDLLMRQLQLDQARGARSPKPPSPSRPQGERESGHDPESQPGRAAGRKPVLPRGWGWILRRVPMAAGGVASQLRVLLTDPAMAAVLQAEPRAGRMLRPLCRMLGIRPAPDLPAALFPAARRPAPPAPPAPAAYQTQPAQMQPAQMHSAQAAPEMRPAPPPSTIATASQKTA